jgi:organic radical activating enzyme
MLNQQPIEKREAHPNGDLEIQSIFYTIQGEGPFAGTPAVFIRLAGCNLQCPGCDTDYTSQRRYMTIVDITTSVNDACGYNVISPLIVITGGEPFRQNLEPLLKRLRRLLYWVQIETNGTIQPPKDFEYEQDLGKRDGIYIVCSPKTGRVHPIFHEVACCFKYVMSYDSVSKIDGLPIKVLNHNVKSVVARPKYVTPLYERDRVPIYLEPMDHGIGDNPDDLARNEASLEACKASCLRYGYILGLQLHKIIGVD